MAESLDVKILADKVYNLHQKIASGEEEDDGDGCCNLPEIDLHTLGEKLYLLLKADLRNAYRRVGYRRY